MNVFILIPLVGLIFSSCGQPGKLKGVDFNLEISPETITDFLYVKMNYDFKINKEFKSLDNDYSVFVHFWRVKTKEMLLQDDHQPSKFFNLWKSGDSIKYTRVVFLPKFLDEYDVDFEGIEEVKVTVGLYKSKDGNESKKYILFEKVFDVESASLNAPELIYDEGWNQPEFDAKIKDPDTRSWRWTKKKAVCIVQNPHKESLLVIRGGVDKAKIENQKVIFKINDQLLDEFIPESARFEKEYKISPNKMGTEDEFKLVIETDQTFIPSELDPNVTDNRELGMQIYFLYFRENTK